MRNWLRFAVFGVAALAWSQSPSGLWDATVVANGLTIPFRFELSGSGNAVKGSFFNGDDKVTSSAGSFSERVLRLDYDYLVSLKGIGPYAAAHCRVLLHDFTRLPVDSGVSAYLRERHGCDPAEFIANRPSWGPYLALGYRLARLRDKLAAGEPI